MTTENRTAPAGTEARARLAGDMTARAGKHTWELFERGVESETKADRTPVTVADRQAEEMLRAAIGKAFPGDGFLGEEYGEEPSRTGFRWIIDPIDATANFVRGIPIFGTLVGLEHEGDLVAGFVYVPALKQLYRAVRGQGAFRDDRRIAVSDIGRFEDGLLIYSSLRFFDKAGVTGEFLDLERRFPRTRGFGDFFGFLIVADGSAEIMIDPVVSPWDVAALKPIVEEAGGVFTDWHGKPTIYGQGAVAANPAIHRQAMAVIREFAPS